MALTEETTIDQITVDKNGNVLVREATRVSRDGVVIATTYHRTSHSKDDAIPADAPAIVKAVGDAARAEFAKRIPTEAKA